MARPLFRPETGAAVSGASGRYPRVGGKPSGDGGRGSPERALSVGVVSRTLRPLLPSKEPEVETKRGC